MRHFLKKSWASWICILCLQRGPEIDELTEYLFDRESNPAPPNLELIRQNADTAIQASQKRNQIQYAKRSVSPTIYKTGDYIVVRNVDNTVGQNKKFISKYRGPYVVHRALPNDRYVVRDVGTCMTQVAFYQ